MTIEKCRDARVIVDEIFSGRAGSAVAGVDVVHPRDRFPQSAQCVVHLAGIVGRHVRILRTGDQQQRCGDAIGVEDGRMRDVLLRRLPQRGSDTILALLGRVHVTHAESW